jgi:hypothetical protein
VHRSSHELLLTAQEDGADGGAPTGLTADTSNKLKIGKNQGPMEVERRCTDWPFAIAFLVLFLFVTGYGIR